MVKKFYKVQTTLLIPDSMHLSTPDYNSNFAQYLVKVFNVQVGESMGLRQRELLRRTEKIGAEGRSEAPLRLPR